MTFVKEGVAVEVIVRGCVAAAKVVVKGGVVVTGAEIQLRRKGRQRFNLLKGDFNCYTAN